MNILYLEGVLPMTDEKNQLTDDELEQVAGGRDMELVITRTAAGSYHVVSYVDKRPAVSSTLPISADTVIHYAARMHDKVLAQGGSFSISFVNIPPAEQEQFQPWVKQ